MQETLIKAAWQNGGKFNHDGGSYRVGKMSYGRFFLEPWDDHFPNGMGENREFSKGTLWLRFDKTKKAFLVDELFS